MNKFNSCVILVYKAYTVQTQFTIVQFDGLNSFLNRRKVETDFVK